MALTNPVNFQLGNNKWSRFDGKPKYSDFIRNVVKPYLNSGAKTPPYYQGSYAIFSTTAQNKADLNNLANGPDGRGISSTANVNLAAPLPKFGETDKLLSELTQEEYKSATVRKPINFGRETTIQNIGATTKVGNTSEDLTPNDQIIQLNLDRVISNHTNIEDGQQFNQIGTSVAAGLAGNLGTPILSQGVGALGQGFLPPTYATVPFSNLGKMKIPGVAFQDFRSRKGFRESAIVGKRIDGTATIARKDIKGKERAIAYLAASVAPGGAYSLFNKESIYGEADAGEPFALRNDFTAKTVASTQWDSSNGGKWVKTKEPLALVNAFRGDKVNVIDFKKSRYSDVYKWLGKLNNEETNKEKKDFGKIFGSVLNDPGVTQDYIKFFFTGPNIGFGDTDSKDDIITFRAVITNLFDSYNPGYTPIQMIGRADPNYHYTQFSRDMNLDFDIAANDRDELKPIWRKLNALAGYTAPTYDKETIALVAPYMRITIGDILVQQPILIQSLTLTLADSDTTWDINIENDESRMQVSNKISVSMGFVVITDYLPEKGGRFYTLAKEAAENPRYHKPGENNWLSDFDVDIRDRIPVHVSQDMVEAKTLDRHAGGQ